MPDLSHLQAAIAAERRDRGFTSDPLQLLTLLVEEVGEIACELKGTWSPNYEDPVVDRLAAELADALVLLTALASRYDIDVAEAVQRKFFETDGRRDWPSADKPAPDT